MFGSAVLELAIGIVFVFLLVSLICSQIGNAISDLLKWRAIELENGIRDLILNGDVTQLEQLYNSPLITSLRRQETVFQRVAQAIPWVSPRAGPKVASIPARTFILALFDTFVPNASGMTTVAQLTAAVSQMGNSPLKQRFETILTATNGQIDDVRKNVEDWFNGAMDRVTEVYKQNMWRLALVIGIITSVVLNVDTLAVASNLWRDPTLRTVVANTASDYAKNSSATQGKAAEELNKLNLPIGWDAAPLPEIPLLPTPKDWMPRSTTFAFIPSLFLKIIGWLITGFASAQGSPFWFDLLKKLTSRDTSPQVRA